MTAVAQHDHASHLVTLPNNLTGYCSIQSVRSPFAVFVDSMSEEAKLPHLVAGEITISRRDFAVLREATRAWAKARGMSAQLNLLAESGVTAPLISNNVPGGHALVVEAGAL